MKNKISVVLLLLSMLMITSVVAAGEITQDADRLNYWTAESHVITVENTGTLSTNATIASSLTVTAVSGDCSEPVADTVTCIMDAAGTGTYTVTSDASVGEYATAALTLTTNNSYTSETVTLVRMQDSEIFSQLVEYGRGRGNYFYDSSTNTKGVQCDDLPAESDIELNYLHKVFPTINTYLNLPAAEGSNVSFACVYENNTIIKTHLATNIAQNSTNFDIDYGSDWIKTSWERAFFAVQDIDSGETAIGGTLDVTCTNMQYYLPDANGWVKVDSDSFTLNYQNSSPISVAATSDPTEIGTGTSEVEITYTITNNEDITLSSSSNPLMIDIEAPPGAEFIGTRMELWGTGQNIYHYEITSLGANEAVNITLVARFDTAGAGTPVLSNGVTVSFVPCWQINAYNPLTTEQVIAVTDTITVNATGVSVTSLEDEISDIQTDLTNIETKIDALTSTVNIINGSIVDITSTLVVMNDSINTIDGIVDTININTDDLEAGQTSILAYLAAMNVTLDLTYNSTQDTYNYLTGAVTDYLNAINISTQNTEIIVGNINTTNNELLIYVQNINGTVEAMNITMTNIDNSVTEIGDTVNNINSTVQTIYDLAYSMNLTINYISNTVTSINGSVGAITDYTARFDTIDASLTTAATNLRQLEEFEEESIYLITDSIVAGQESYKEALVAYSEGNMELTEQKLQESVNLLAGARDTAIGLQQDAITERAALQPGGFFTRVVAFIKNIFGG